MTRRTVSILIFILSLSLAFTSEIKIAPLAVFDSNGNAAEFSSSPSRIIYTELEKHWFEGLLSFSYLDEKKYEIPVTIVDANKICISEKSDYLLYGFIKKNESSWQCEVKLYDANSKKNLKQFFASDSLEYPDRLMDVLCQNILYGLEEITGLTADTVIAKKNHPAEISIPISPFYWTPVDSEWGSRILGIAGVATGIEFYPEQPSFALKGKLLDFSLKLNLLWKIGINKEEGYPLILNTAAVSLPVLFHIHFDMHHSLYCGAGLCYSFEFMKIRPKYENEKFLYQNIFSAEAVLGYEYCINNKVKMFTEVVADFALHEDGFISIRPGIGAAFTVFRGKK